MQKTTEPILSGPQKQINGPTKSCSLQLVKLVMLVFQAKKTSICARSVSKWQFPTIHGEHRTVPLHAFEDLQHEFQPQTAPGIKHWHRKISSIDIYIYIYIYLFIIVVHYHILSTYEMICSWCMFMINVSNLKKTADIYIYIYNLTQVCNVIL